MLPYDQNNPITLGIDIGSSKIVVATCRNVHAEIITTQSNEARAFPFCFAFRGKEHLFGDAAVEHFKMHPDTVIFGTGKVSVLKHNRFSRMLCVLLYQRKKS